MPIATAPGPLFLLRLELTSLLADTLNRTDRMVVPLG